MTPKKWDPNQHSSANLYMSTKKNDIKNIYIYI